jgi:hypothetical protein
MATCMDVDFKVALAVDGKSQDFVCDSKILHKLRVKGWGYLPMVSLGTGCVHPVFFCVNLYMLLIENIVRGRSVYTTHELVHLNGTFSCVFEF